MNIVRVDGIDTTVSNMVSQNFEYPETFILQVNKYTGVLRSRIKTMNSSLNNASNATAIKDIAKVLLLSAFTQIEDGKNDLRSNIIASYAGRARLALNVMFKAMDTDLMPMLDCGGKQFCQFSYSWQIKLKIAVLFAIAYQMGQANNTVAIS